MDDNYVREKLEELVLSNSNCITEKEISSDTDIITDLFFDSISCIVLISEIEKEFCIEFPDELLLLEEIRKFSSLYDIVCRCVINN